MRAICTSISDGFAVNCLQIELLLDQCAATTVLNRAAVSVRAAVSFCAAGSFGAAKSFGGDVGDVREDNFRDYGGGQFKRAVFPGGGGANMPLKRRVTLENAAWPLSF